jgi:RNA polymerase sigma factor (sigma-70 family)
MTDAGTLLAEYARNGSEEAFRELLARYINLVYSTAARLVGGDTHLAEDVAQTVFMDLAGAARSLPAGVMIGGWLHRHTCFVARKNLRSERRRQRRERQAAEMNAQHDHSAADLAQVAPILDEAINQLGEEDRAAILLRFFEQLEFRLVGQALGSTEEAARKRVTRALEKLHSIVKRQGVGLSVAALGSALAAQAVTAAPVGFAASIAGPVLAGAATGMGKPFTLLKLMATRKVQSATITAIIIASATLPLVVQFQARARLSRLDDSLRRQNDQLAQTNAEHDRLANLLAQTKNSGTLADNQLREVLRLRNEVGLLKRQVQELTPAQATQPQDQAQEDQLAAMKRKYAAQVDRLKQWLEAHPAEKIPELQNLPDEIWINDVDTLAEDNNFARTAALLRANAEGQVFQTLWPALKKFAQDNNGQFPADLSELKPYFKTPIDDAILQRYAIVPTSSLISELQPGGNWVITEKAAVNPALDMRSAYGLTQMRFADERVTNRWSQVQ